MSRTTDEPTPIAQLIGLPRFTVRRPVPLYDEHGRLVRVVKPGTTGRLVSEYDGSGPGVPQRDRALVRFDDDPARDAWDIELGSIQLDEDGT